MRRFEYIEAGSLGDAAKLTKEAGSSLKAGGVDLMDLMKEHLAEPDRVVSIRKIANLNYIREENGKFTIGAQATLAALSRHPYVLARARAVAVSAGEAASPQIRNQATCAGNLLQRPRCWYFRKEELLCARKGGPECLAQDKNDGENRYHAIFGNKNCAIVHPSNLAPALMLFDGSVSAVKADGSRREIKVAELFVTPETDIHKEHVLEPGEIVESISFDGLPGGDRSQYSIVREKQGFDWPLVAAAVRLVMEGAVVKDARIVLGAVCPIPLRREAAEKAMIGKTLDEASARAAAKVAFDGAAPMSQNGYKIPMGVATLTRALLAAGGQQ